MSDQIVWTCEGCGKPVDDHTGSIHVDPARAMENIGARQELEKSHPDGVWSLGQMLDLPGPVPWEVHHGTCEPNPERSDYWIGVERARSHAQLLRWTAHLSEKRWLSETTWNDLIHVVSGVEL